MVVGGVGAIVFSDVWFLDVTDGSWNEVVYVWAWQVTVMWEYVIHVPHVARWLLYMVGIQVDWDLMGQETWLVTCKAQLIAVVDNERNFVVGEVI